MFKSSTFGLDISDYSIEVLQLSDKNEVLAFGRVLMEAGIVKDGQIQDKEKLIVKIKEVLQSTQPERILDEEKLQVKNVIFALPESKTFIYTFRLPKNLEGKQLKKALFDEAAKVIPLSSSEITYDYQVISSDKNHQEILYVCAPRKIIDQYLEVFREIGLEPVALDIESACLARALIKKYQSEQAVLILDIGARTTNMSIFDQNGIRFSANIPLAGNDFTKAVQQKLNLSWKEAENLKRIVGLEAPKEKEVVETIKLVFDSILKEIKASLDFYQHQTGRQIEKIILGGGSSLMPGLPGYISEKIGLPVQAGENWLGINLGKKSVLFNTVIGAARRANFSDPAQEGLNLLPVKLKESKKIFLTLPKFRRPKLKQRFLFLKRFWVFGSVILIFLILAGLIYSFVYLFPKYTYRTYTISPEEKQDKTPPQTEIIQPAIPPDATSTDQTATSTEELPSQEIVEIVIEDTETGWLNVREGPGLDFEIIDKVYPGESYPLLEETEKWYKIEIDDETEGWVFAQYTIKK